MQTRIQTLEAEQGQRRYHVVYGRDDEALQRRIKELIESGKAQSGDIFINTGVPTADDDELEG